MCSSDLKQNGATIAFITLHVGIGTFRPIKADKITDHKMHPESYFVSENTAELLTKNKNKKRLIAVGSTTTRTLESVFDGEKFIAGQGTTDLFIYPGYKFKCVDCILSNFHLPKSSLLVMMSAFSGQPLMKKAYEQAVNLEYRFFSFGDAMLVMP